MIVIEIKKEEGGNNKEQNLLSFTEKHQLEIYKDLQNRYYNPFFHRP